MSAESFVHDLLHAAPDLKPILDEHFAANDTLLPHVFMADVARFAVAEIADVRKRATILELLNYLGKAHSSLQLASIAAASSHRRSGAKEQGLFESGTLDLNLRLGHGRSGRWQGAAAVRRGGKIGRGDRI